MCSCIPFSLTRSNMEEVDSSIPDLPFIPLLIISSEEGVEAVSLIHSKCAMTPGGSHLALNKREWGI